MLTGVLANLNNSDLCGDARVLNKPRPWRTRDHDLSPGRVMSLPVLQNMQTGSGANATFYSEYETPFSG